MAQPTQEIYVSPGPHVSTKKNTTMVMLCVIIALLPLAVYGVILFGISALVTILVSVATAVLAEWVFQIATKQKVRIKDLSAVVTGLMLALVLPPALPVWMTVLGAIFAIVVAKAFFGGIGANVFNPALTGRAFLFTSFPAAMGSWIRPFDGLSGATILSQTTVSINSNVYRDLFFGTRAGCIGETSILLILIAFVFLLVTRIIDWRAPVAMIATLALCTVLSGGYPLMAIYTGGAMFGAVFMTTDYATAPVTKAGRLIFGIGCGLITFLIREFGAYPEGVMFSILIMNILTPFLNKIIPVKYGYKLKGKGAKAR